MPGVWCERAFAPWTDMEAELRAAGLPLCALESGDPVGEFDVIGFSVGYEMAYTAMLNMLDLAGLPLRSEDRTALTPLVIAGGTAMYNAEPVADFIDMALIGEGEELLPEVVELCRRAKAEGWDKPRLLRAAAQIQGVYVPSLYDVDYKEDGTVRAITARDGAPEKVVKRVVHHMDRAYYLHPGVPVLPGGVRLPPGAVQEPGAAGPVRPGGHCRLRLPGDDPQLPVHQRLPGAGGAVRRPGGDVPGKACEPVPALPPGGQLLHGAHGPPPAGAEGGAHLRPRGGHPAAAGRHQQEPHRGGPHREPEDRLLRRVERGEALLHAGPAHRDGRGLRITVSTSWFVPKPFTAFQWEAQISRSEYERRVRLLREAITAKAVTYNWHDGDTSFLEAVLARGDRRLGRVLERACRKGAKLDAWSDCFDLNRWLEAFAECGLDPAFYANRERTREEILPWSMISCYVSDDYLWRQRQLAYQSVTTPDCRTQCSGCGANSVEGGECYHG